MKRSLFFRCWEKLCSVAPFSLRMISYECSVDFGHRVLPILTIIHLTLLGCYYLGANSPYLFLYEKSNGFMSLFLFWILVDTSSYLSTELGFVFILFSMVMDITSLALAYPDLNPNRISSLSQFSAAMSIMNLILKPITAYFIFVELRQRNGVFSFLQNPDLDPECLSSKGSHLPSHSPVTASVSVASSPPDSSASTECSGGYQTIE